jgi:hypothetical protein
VKCLRQAAHDDVTLAQLWEFILRVDSKVHASADFSQTGLGPLAAGLEGRKVRGRGRFPQWVARVHGVHLDERSCWIQVAPDGDDSACVVLRCSHRATVEHAAAALRHWRPRKSLSLLVLNVMSVA